MSRYKDVKPGLNNVASYQVGARPFTSGAIDPNQLAGNGPYCVKFPAVTQWIHIINHGSQDDRADLKVAFSKSGLTGQTSGSPAGSYEGAPAPGTCHFVVPHKGGTNTPQHHQVTLHVKVTEIWVTGSAAAANPHLPMSFDVIAGLTNIGTGSAGTAAGPSWSGSLGVG
jgi:hypothetical protein